MSISDAARHAEVTRILQSSSAEEALGMELHGAPPNALRQAYLRRSLLVHPDKCNHPKAGEAFRCLTDAYKTLTEGNSSCGSSGFASASSPPQRDRPYEDFRHSRSSSDVGFDPFEFFRKTAQQGFQAGDLSQADFSQLFGRPEAMGGALLGAAVVGGLAGLLGGALGAASDAARNRSECSCQHSFSGRCDSCRSGLRGSSSAGGAAVGLAFGAMFGAAVGAALGSAVASAKSSDDRARGRAAGAGTSGAGGHEGSNVTHCAVGHLLERRVEQSFRRCDNCGFKQSPGALTWCCPRCCRDICPRCGGETGAFRPEGCEHQ